MRRIAMVVGLAASLAAGGVFTWRATRADVSPLPEPRVHAGACAVPEQDFRAFGVGATEQDLRNYFGGSNFGLPSRLADSSRPSCIAFFCPASMGIGHEDVWITLLMNDGKVSAKWLQQGASELPVECDGRVRELLFIDRNSGVHFPTAKK
jgi:hypothetical protein